MEAGAARNQTGFDQQSTFIAGHKRQQRAANQHQIEHATAHALSIACTDCPATSVTLSSRGEVECWILADFHRVQLLTIVCPCGQLEHELPMHIGFFENTPEQLKAIFEALRRVCQRANREYARLTLEMDFLDSFAGANGA